ncbi:hypothetical protein ACFOD4_14165 [Pseudoroseomonas globiformis]|uniref:DUF3102 domain-containing protein n=1 Tax=Teichococcus globiformis TaxID=2307229 RepID=A0ABV7G0N1_9PROT
MRKPAKGVSRRGLDSLNIDDLPTADTRPQQLERLTTISGEDLDTLTDVFAGTSVLEDPGKVSAILQARRQVSSAWTRASESYLEIGRALNELDRRLAGKHERSRLKAGFSKLFPFSDPIASQFRRVAAMVDDGRIEKAALPGSYSAAYQLALLEADELEDAKKAGLVTPSTTRSLIIKFRKKREHSVSVAGMSSLKAELKRNLDQQDRLRQELDRLRLRAAEIRQLVDDQKARRGA